MDNMKSIRKRLVTVTVLASICLITGGILYYLLIYPNRSLGMEGDAWRYHCDKLGELQGTTIQVWYDIGIGITVKGKKYSFLSARDRVKYGLLEESFVEERLKPVYPHPDKDPDWYKHHFVRGDIGKFIGKVEESSYGMLVGLKVYHYSAYPDSDDICILKLGGEYGYVFFGLKDTED